MTMKKKEIIEVLDLLKETYPDAECALNHRNIFELLVSVVLSAQTTDKSVNLVTPDLFAEYPDAFALSQADPLDVAEYIRRIGMYKTKSKNIVNLSKELVERFDGQVPSEHEALISLPGVGRKTANVVRSVGFGIPAIAVDTHVFRVANRIGLAKGKDVLTTEEALMKNIPKERWSEAHHSIIFHGRNCCSARNPKCEECSIVNLCEKNHL